jgi:hypothetical protein
MKDLETIKFLEENIRRTHPDIGLVMIWGRNYTKVTRTEINKHDYMKLKSFSKQRKW